MLLKLESITFKKFGSRDFRQIASSILNKGKSTIPPLFNGLEVLSSASKKQNYLLKAFLKTNFDDSGKFLSVFPSRIGV